MASANSAQRRMVLLRAGSMRRLRVQEFAWAHKPRVRALSVQVLQSDSQVRTIGLRMLLGVKLGLGLS